MSAENMWPRLDPLFSWIDRAQAQGGASVELVARIHLGCPIIRPQMICCKAFESLQCTRQTEAKAPNLRINGGRGVAAPDEMGPGDGGGWYWLTRQRCLTATPETRQPGIQEARHDCVLRRNVRYYSILGEIVLMRVWVDAIPHFSYFLGLPFPSTVQGCSPEA